MNLREYDVVRLLRERPEHGLAAGAVGAIVMVYKVPPAYEVEFCDKDGVTVALITLEQSDLEKVDNGDPG